MSILQLFYLGTDNNIYSRWRRPDGSWSGELHLSGVINDNGKVVATNLPNTNILQLFHRGPDSSLYTRWRDPDGSWSGEQHLGGGLNGDPTVVRVPGTD